mmetsp:Transcript_57320/g.184177  ORF Transcript_57320/g.184177 Transcript_57320/m.184177 type:complete len:238 (-) Transcript_57320:213-926(-)
MEERRRCRRRGGTSSSQQPEAAELLPKPPLMVDLRQWQGNAVLREFLSSFDESMWPEAVQSACLLGLLCLGRVGARQMAIVSELRDLVERMEHERPRQPRSPALRRCRSLGPGVRTAGAFGPMRRHLVTNDEPAYVHPTCLPASFGPAERASARPAVATLDTDGLPATRPSGHASTAPAAAVPRVAGLRHPAHLAPGVAWPPLDNQEELSPRSIVSLAEDCLNSWITDVFGGLPTDV